MQTEKLRIGDLLVSSGKITDEQLKDALSNQKRTGIRLGQTLVDMGLITEDHLLSFLSSQLDLPVVNLHNHQYKKEDLKILPETIARRFRAIPLSIDEGVLRVGIVDPTNLIAYDEISRIVGMPIQFAIVKSQDLTDALDLVYRRTDEIIDFAGQLDKELSDEEFDLEELSPLDDEHDTAVVKLITSLFEDAVQINTSDIHIEPSEDGLRIRQRVDGILQEHIMKEKRIATALTQRLKLMANLNITEKRLPQDGRFSLKVKIKKSIFVCQLSQPLLVNPL